MEERLAPGPVREAVVQLALDKARAVAATRRDAVVLGADTVVVIDGEALGKPSGPEDARAMLHRLRGRRHEVVTGVAVVDGRSGRAWLDSVVTQVLMAAYDDAVIDAYVASGEPLDKAGAYAIQEGGEVLVAGLVGSYTNVIGLPLAATRRLLAAAGAPVSAGGAA